MTSMNDMRREYGNRELHKSDVDNDPLNQFQRWWDDALKTGALDPNAMVLSTVDAQGHPDSRVVLLKEFDSSGFTFYTHFNSPKGHQIEQHPIVALNFYWAALSRQVRIKGSIEKVSREMSETYFASRPRQSQICTASSHQSEVIESRYALEKQVQVLSDQYANAPIPCPPNWGGYRVIPTECEFFQGRDNRLNDRIRYVKQNTSWKIERLSP